MQRTSPVAAFFKAVGFIALFLGCQVASALVCDAFFTVILLKKGLTDSEFATALTNAHTKNLYVIMLLSYLLFLGISALISQSRFPEDIGAKKTGPLPLTLGVLFGFGAFPVIAFILSLLSKIPVVAESQSNYSQEMEMISSAGGNPFIELFAICIAGPILEEILFRGYVLGHLKKGFSEGTAIVLTGVAFGIIHGNIYQLVFTVPLGIAMSFLAHKFQSLWPSVLMHIAFNTSNYLPHLGGVFGYKETDTPYLFIYYAVMLFYPFALIVGTVLYRNHYGEKKPFAFPRTKEEWSNFIFVEKEVDMAAPEYIIVGLGNPGAKYERNRHNAGFLALDYLSAKTGIPVKNLKFKALCGEGFLGGKKVLLMKPQTFMNLSGEAVREAAAFYKIPPEKILILFDDICFQPGVFRIREKGSAGGHNGIKSIIACLGSESFPRVKIGVGAVPEGWDLMHHVLGNPCPEDMAKITASFDDICETTLFFVRDDLRQAGARFNGKLHG